MLEALEGRPGLLTFLVVAVTLLALGLRLYRLGEWSFWGDEMITVNRASQLGGLSLARQSPSLILTSLSLSVFGVSEWSARLAPALLGALTVPILYFLVSRVYGGAAALLAAVLLAISPWHLYWSQNARFYTSLLLWYTLGLFFFHFGLERDRPWLMLASLASFGLAAVERPTALFFLPVILGYLILLRLLRYRQPAGRTLRNLALFFLPGVIPGVFVLFSFPAVQDPSRWQGLFGFVNNNPFWILAGVAYYVGIPTVLLGLASGLDLFVRRDRAGLLLLLSAVIPLAAVLLLSIVQYSANRYVFVTLVGWVVLAGVAGSELIKFASDQGPRILAAGVLGVLLAMPLSSDILYFYFQNGNRDNWKAAFAYVAENREPDDLVVSANRQLALYYLGGNVRGMQGLDLEELVQTGERVWFVMDLNVDQKWPDVRLWASENARLMAEFDVHVEARNFDMDVYLYVPQEASSEVSATALETNPDLHEIPTRTDALPHPTGIMDVEG